MSNGKECEDGVRNPYLYIFKSHEINSGWGPLSRSIEVKDIIVGRIYADNMGYVPEMGSPGPKSGEIRS